MFKALLCCIFILIKIFLTNALRLRAMVKMHSKNQIKLYTYIQKITHNRNEFVRAN